jgi:hypothetical protein
MPLMVLTRDQRQALELLANAGEACAVPALVRGGCAPEELQLLVRRGLVRAERIQTQGKPSRADFQLCISDDGRKALARRDERPAHGMISAMAVLIVLFFLALLAGMAVGAFILPHP